MKIRVTAGSGKKNKFSFNLEEGVQFPLGRDTSEIRLDYPSVSGTHCFLVIENGALYVKDNKSKNGTFLNNETIQEAIIEVGDIIQLGEASIEILKAPQPPEVAAPETQFIDIQGKNLASLAPENTQDLTQNQTSSHSTIAVQGKNESKTVSERESTQILPASEIENMGDVIPERFSNAQEKDREEEKEPSYVPSPEASQTEDEPSAEISSSIENHDGTLMGTDPIEEHISAKEIQKNEIEEKEDELEEEDLSQDLMAEEDDESLPDLQHEKTTVMPKKPAPEKKEKKKSKHKTKTVDLRQIVASGVVGQAEKTMTKIRIASRGTFGSYFFALLSSVALGFYYGILTGLLSKGDALLLGGSFFVGVPLLAFFLNRVKGFLEAEGNYVEILSFVAKFSLLIVPLLALNYQFPGWVKVAVWVGIVLFIIRFSGKFTALLERVFLVVGSLSVAAWMGVGTLLPHQPKVAEGDFRNSSQGLVDQLKRAAKENIGFPSQSKTMLGTKVPDLLAVKRLFAAVREGDMMTIQKMVEVEKLGVNISSSDGNTPLMIAAFNGNLELVKYLLSQGAEVNAIDNNGTTPLMWASYEGHKKIVLHLLENGAQPKMKKRDGDTAIQISKQWGHEDIAKILEEFIPGKTRSPASKDQEDSGDQERESGKEKVETEEPVQKATPKPKVATKTPVKRNTQKVERKKPAPQPKVVEVKRPKPSVRKPAQKRFIPKRTDVTPKRTSQKRTQPPVTRATPSIQKVRKKTVSRPAPAVVKKPTPSTRKPASLTPPPKVAPPPPPKIEEKKKPKKMDPGFMPTI